MHSVYGDNNLVPLAFAKRKKNILKGKKSLKVFCKGLQVMAWLYNQRNNQPGVRNLYAGS